MFHTLCLAPQETPLSTYAEEYKRVRYNFPKCLEAAALLLTCCIQGVGVLAC